MLIKRWGKRFGVTLALLALFIFLPLIYPQPLFAYSVVQGEFSVHSDQPIPKEQAEQFLSEVKQRLDQSPIQNGEMSMQIYVANTAWRRHWLWIVPPNDAGGFVATPMTRRHTFFSGANFETDELILPTGYHTQPPRTLSYYGAHEFTHIATAEKVGWIGIARMPVWVREGIADYVAMPPERAATLYSKIGEEDADLTMMRAYGVYAPYRLLVTYFLEEAEWSIDQLLASDLTLEEAREIVFKALR